MGRHKFYYSRRSREEAQKGVRGINARQIPRATLNLPAVLKIIASVSKTVISTRSNNWNT